MQGLSTSQAAGFGAFMGYLAGIATVLCVILIVYYVLLVVAWWKLFTKAGEKGWKAIIPFYNFYIQCKLTWAPKFFWIIIILTVVSWIITAIPAIAAVGVWISLIIAIVVFVLTIISQYRLAKAYGHAGGYTVGLVFLNFIFMLILGFGKSKYEGNVYLKEQKKK